MTDNSIYTNPLITRYASKEMQHAFSDEKRFKLWRKLWIALAESEMELGLNVTQEQVDELKEYAEDIDYELAAKFEREVRHDVMAHVKAYGAKAQKAMPIIHLGATSCFVNCNAEAIMLDEALDIILKKLVNVMDKLKRFFVRYSYDAVKMLLDQIVLAVFGFSLATAAVIADSRDLLLWVSIGAIVFYLFMLYGVAWRMGDEDRKRIRRGEWGGHTVTGMLVSLLANSVNFLLAALIAVGTLAGVDALVDIPKVIALLAQAEYQGLLAYIPIGVDAEGAMIALNNAWWVYLLLPIPAMLISAWGYLMGKGGVLLTKLTVPDLPVSDRPTKQEKRERTQQEKNNRE